jgi:hypothetical protein
MVEELQTSIERERFSHVPVVLTGLDALTR